MWTPELPLFPLTTFSFEDRNMYLQRMLVVVMYCLNSMPLGILIMLLLLELEFLLDTLNSRNLSCVLLEAVDIDSAHRQVWSPVAEQPLYLDFFVVKKCK